MEYIIIFYSKVGNYELYGPTCTEDSIELVKSSFDKQEIEKYIENNTLLNEENKVYEIKM